MSNIAFPTISYAAPPSIEWRLESVAQSFTSPLDGSTQTGSLLSAKWACGFQLQPLMEDDAVEVQAFLVKLRGLANRALIKNFARPVPRGTIALASVTVDGAVSAGASVLSLANCGAAATLKTGDFFSVANELKMVVDGPYTADGSGNMASVAFEPPSRAAWSNGASVTTNAPTCIMRLADPRAAWTTRVGKLTEISLEFVEAFA